MELCAGYQSYKDQHVHKAYGNKVPFFHQFIGDILKSDTKEQLADLFTKGLLLNTICTLMNKLMSLDSSDLSRVLHMCGSLCLLQ